MTTTQTLKRQSFLLKNGLQKIPGMLELSDGVISFTADQGKGGFKAPLTTLAWFKQDSKILILKTGDAKYRISFVAADSKERQADSAELIKKSLPICLPKVLPE